MGEFKKWIYFLREILGRLFSLNFPLCSLLGPDTIAASNVHKRGLTVVPKPISLFMRSWRKLMKFKLLICMTLETKGKKFMQYWKEKRISALQQWIVDMFVNIWKLGVFSCQPGDKEEDSIHWLLIHSRLQVMVHVTLLC